MYKNENIIIIGYSGSGKSYMSNLLKKDGFNIISAGNVLREECGNLGLKTDRKSLRKYGKKILSDYGEVYFAKLLISYMDINSKNVFEGIRPFKTIEYIKEKINSKIIYIEADAKIRFERLSKRDNMNIVLYEAMENDLHEKQIGRVKGIADIVLYNNASIKEFKENVLSLNL